MPARKVLRVTMLLTGVAVVCATASEVFLSPQAEVFAGYESDRVTGSGRGSAFVAVAPGIEWTRFGEATEAALRADLRHTLYGSDELESTDEFASSVFWRRYAGRTEAGARLGGGLYRDRAMPAEDRAYGRASPYVVRTLQGAPVALSVRVSVEASSYDSPSRTDWRTNIRPGAEWTLSQRASVWSEVYAERKSSDTAAFEYDGFGGALGCSIRPRPRLDLAIWGGPGVRSFDAGDRRDTLWPGGLRLSYRLRPNIELFGAGEWERWSTTSGANDENWWRAFAGLRVVLEIEPGRRTR